MRGLNWFLPGPGKLFLSTLKKTSTSKLFLKKFEKVFLRIFPILLNSWMKLPAPRPCRAETHRDFPSIPSGRHSGGLIVSWRSWVPRSCSISWIISRRPGPAGM
ncbi:hypothetical protein AN220_13410 [Streptomyces nanshensis]|nr:hypothetical protein AN220_13410 [Streptomyces nanshensis]